MSPEEARWDAYQELRASGSCAQALQRFKAQEAEKRAQRQQVLSLLQSQQVRE